MSNLLLGMFIGFFIGAIVLFVSFNSTFRHAVSFSIDSATFSKAGKVCKDHGGLLLRIVAYYDKDVFYCDNMKIIAKKDRAQGMWVSFEVVKPVMKDSDK